MSNGYTGPTDFYCNKMPSDMHYVVKRHQRLKNELTQDEREGHKMSLEDSNYQEKSNPTLDLSSESYIAKIMDRPNPLESHNTGSRKALLDRRSNGSAKPGSRKKIARQTFSKNPCFLNVYESETLVMMNAGKSKGKSRTKSSRPMSNKPSYSRRKNMSKKRCKIGQF